jgi:hypothetical protein
MANLKQALTILVVFCTCSFLVPTLYFVNKERGPLVTTTIQTPIKEKDPPEIRPTCPIVPRYQFNRTIPLTPTYATNTKVFLPSQIHYSHNKQVFILSLPRSGSSFLGELFKQNPDFIYLYEVTRALINTQECSKTLPDTHANTLKAMFSCDFRNLKEKMDAATWGMKGFKK